MPFTDNNGSQYYALSCGVPSDGDWDANANNGSRYYHLSANDFILWGQSESFQHPQSNNGSEYYFYQCVRDTDDGWNPNDNNGTKFYYSSAFNCVSFCNRLLVGIGSYEIPDGGFYLQPDGSGRYSFEIYTYY